MHMIIRAIVYAKDIAQAKSKAESIFRRMSGEGQEFDYYNLFSNPYAEQRWGKKDTVYLADSKEGKELIEEGMKATEADFKIHISKVRAILRRNKVPSKLMKKSDFRYHCHCIGEYRGSDVWLYDDDGEGIRDREHLRLVLTSWNENRENIYVVPADVHF